MTAGTLDNRTLFNEGDSNTGWNAGSPTTTAFAEPTASIAQGYGETEGALYYAPGGNVAVSGQMIYVYSQVVATQSNWWLGYHGLYLTDGTNEVCFNQSGADREVFKHSEGPVGFQCFLLDADYADQKDAHPSGTYIVAGSFANLWNNIKGDTLTGIGAYYITLSKALGGGVNCYCDIIRYGNDGITIVDGNVSNPATFLDVVEIDRSTEQDQKAHGIIREYTPGIYGVQGPLNFGDANLASGVYFVDDGVVVVFENRDILNNRYYFDVEGNSSVTNRFELSNSTISTAGPYVSMTMASGNLNVLNLDSVVFSNLGNNIRFSDWPDASGHYINSCNFTGCGQIDPGITYFTNNTIANPTSSGTGGLYLDAATGEAARFSGLSFISEGAGHAVYIAESGYYTFTNFSYTGYGATGTDDAEVFNDSGGSVLITISGGSSPTYKNGAAGSETNIASSVPIAVTVIDEDGNAIENAQVALYVGGTQVMNEDSQAGTGLADADYTGSTPTSATLRVRKGSATDSPKYLPHSTTQTIGVGGLTVTVTLIEDTNNNS